MARLRAARISKKHNTVVCPHCKRPALRYAEDDITRRHVGQFDEEGGTLIIDSHFDCYGDGGNPRFQCGDCGKDSSIPKGLKFDWARWRASSPVLLKP